jgi:lipid II:glycine glycyltransferase (peptidoglycan interpeptide bridge formation enzyme)
MRENNVDLDTNIETLRSNADSINNYVERNSIESKEQIAVRLAEKRLKQLQGQLVRVHEQIKVKLASAGSLQVEIEIAEVALKDALTIGKQQIEYVK